MQCSEDILISVKPVYFGKMLRGEKSVELRRRRIHVSVGTTVWIYETSPSGRLGGISKVSAIYENTPVEIWKEYGDRAGIAQDDFFTYFKGVTWGCVVVLTAVRPLRMPLQLADLRKLLGVFVAPQFYRKLEADGPEVTLFREYASTGEGIVC